MKHIFFLASICFLLLSCNNSNKFVVEGTIKDAKDKVLYLEHTGMIKTVIVDSVKLKESGNFKFKANRPAYPDFYRLRIENKQIIFAIDSTETIDINSQFQNFAMDYTIEGSPVSVQIQHLRKSLNAIQTMYDQITPKMDENERNSRIENIKMAIEVHKDSVRNIILKDAKSLAAYLGLHQQIAESMLFSPYTKEDQPYYNAVATAFYVSMPEYERTKNMYGNAMDARQLEREKKEKQSWDKLVQEAGKGYIDITLWDKNDNERKLSSLEGKVILLDFLTYNMPGNSEYIFALRDMYEKYNKKGFEIYQVSLDQSKIIWTDAVENLPWICVREKDGPSNRAAGFYNVQSVPTAFLINRKGDIISRLESLDNAEKLIKDNL